MPASIRLASLGTVLLGALRARAGTDEIQITHIAKDLLRR